MNTEQFTIADWFGVFLAFGGVMMFLSAIALIIVLKIDGRH